MTTLRIGNDYAFLVTEESWLRELFFHKLRFRKRDYFHHPLYKQKLWDGYINFFNKNNGRFLTGLLVEIQAALKELNVPYQIEDHRTIVDFAYENIDNQFLARLSPDGSGVTLHDYQVDITNKAIKYKRGIIQAPTGAGKTNIMVSIIQALKPGTPTLFLSKAADLIVQNYEELLKWGVPNVGCLGAGFKKPNVITCSTIDSLHHIERLLPHIRVLIVDEVHQLMSAKPLAAYKKMKNASVRLGISATPFKFGEKDYVQKWNVKGWFGPILLTDTTKSGKITTKDLQDRDILPPSLCTFYTINQPQIPWDVYGDAVTNGIANSWYLHQVIKGLAATLKGRTIILVERLAQGDALHKLIPGSLWVQGKDTKKTRKWVKDQLRNSKEDVVAIASQKIMTAGIDIFVHNLVNAAGGKADHEILQRLGRGLRKAKDKTLLRYYDFLFRINKYLDEHSDDRVKMLQAANHEVVVKDEIDFPI